MDIDLRYGDAIEFVNIEWIRQNIPEYEVLWARFIGHDGHGQPLEPTGLKELSQDERTNFFQAHYSALLCLLALRDINYAYQEHLGQVQTVPEYLQSSRDMICFMAHLGRLRDMFKKMDVALRLGNSLWKQFDDFYAQRNNLIHGPIPAHRLVDGFLQMPTPAGREIAKDKWTEDSKWQNANSYSFENVSVFFKRTLAEAINHTRSGISQCLTRLKELEPAVAEPIQVTYQPPAGVSTSASGGLGAPLSGIAASGTDYRPYRGPL